MILQDWLHAALAMVHRSGKEKGGGDQHTIHIDIAPMPFIDLHPDYSFAMSLSWRGDSFTRTPVITTAKLDILTFDMPLYIRHFDIPPVGKQVHLMFANRVHLYCKLS
jgi:hypothetical protein